MAAPPVAGPATLDLGGHAERADPRAAAARAQRGVRATHGRRAGAWRAHRPNPAGTRLVGRKDLPARDFKELLVYLKANADKVNIAHAGLGAVSHLCSVLFRQAIGVDLATIPCQGTGPALNALLGGQVDLLCDQTTSTTPQIKADGVKLYGVTTSSRWR